MLSIGAFAQLGRVTRRMLRHWDAAGLLVPEHVDQVTGYRSYDPSQLERLHRIVALRQLGFGLDDIALILTAGIDADRLTELLRARRAEVAAEHRLAEERLRDVSRRLHLIEQENPMTATEIIRKPLSPLRLAALSGHAAEQPEVPAVVGPLFAQVAKALVAAGTTPGLAIATYDMGEDGLRITAGFEVSGEVPSSLEEVVLPAAEDAFCSVHLGAMDSIPDSWQALHPEIVARGAAPSGPARELYLRSEPTPQVEWVTELQQPASAG